MKQERVILSFIFVLIGLLAAGILFYFYQSTKVVNNAPSNVVSSPTPTVSEKSNIFISIDQPADEAVVSSKTLQISGKTIANATIVIITDSDQFVLQPTAVGNFSTTVTLNNGQNLITIQAIAQNGETVSLKRTVTYSTENF
jgi:hypothetical protein